MLEAMNIAERNSSVVALSLPDTQCVERHREAFFDALTRHARMVFANEREIISLFDVETLDEALDRTSHLDALFALTRTEKGCVVVSGNETIVQDAYPVDEMSRAVGDTPTAIRPVSPGGAPPASKHPPDLDPRWG